MAHIHENIDFTVEVFIVYKDKRSFSANKVLLRKHDKYKIWLSIGGHIELDEDPNEAAIREVKEEVGLDVTIDSSLKIRDENSNQYRELIPPHFLNRNRISENHEHITMTYFATSETDKISETIEREKSEDIRWFTKDDLENDTEIVPNVKFYALQALEKLGR